MLCSYERAASEPPSHTCMRDCLRVTSSPIGAIWYPVQERSVSNSLIALDSHEGWWPRCLNEFRSSSDPQPLLRC